MVREYYEERAAILEFSAGLPRFRAEKEAEKEAAKYKLSLWRKGYR
jgi:hypothetical protein